MNEITQSIKLHFYNFFTMTDLGYRRNNKGGQTLIYKGFEFNHHRETASWAIHWRCSKFRSLIVD